MPDAITDFVDTLKQRVADLGKLDVHRKVFGAGSHQYGFAKPYPEAELASFEKRIGITLPEDYRAFITQIGNGGAGPSYGVIGFRANDSEDYTAYEELARPWAYAETHNPIELFDYGDGNHGP